MRQIDAIINPAAGGGRAQRRWPSIARQIHDAGVILKEHITTRRGQAAEFARQAILHNASEILIAGGDGTINEVANELLDSGPRRSSCVVSLMPLGSGCDFARNIGIGSTQDALAALMGDHVQAVDAGHISCGGATESRCFINSADIGLGACVARRVNRSNKRLGGTVAYFTAALCEITTAPPRTIRIKVDDELVQDGPSLMALIVNGRCYGGGMIAAPTASAIDGMLDLIILKQASKVNLMFSLLPRVYQGAHIGHPAVIATRGRRIEVECDRPTPLALDGEVTCAQAAIISVVPGALHVRVPACLDAINSRWRR